MNVHGYFGVQRLDVGQTTWETFLQVLWDMAVSPDDVSPAKRPHTRTSLDETKVIYEGLYDETDLTVTGLKQLLADVFGVDVGDIDHTINFITTGGYTSKYITLIYNAINRVRFGLFGFETAWPTWDTSRCAARAYWMANKEDWE